MPAATLVPTQHMIAPRLLARASSVFSCKETQQVLAVLYLVVGAAKVTRTADMPSILGLKTPAPLSMQAELGLVAATVEGRQYGHTAGASGSWGKSACSPAHEVACPCLPRRLPP